MVIISIDRYLQPYRACRVIIISHFSLLISKLYRTRYDFYNIYQTPGALDGDFHRHCAAGLYWTGFAAY